MPSSTIRTAPPATGRWVRTAGSAALVIGLVLATAAPAQAAAFTVNSAADAVDANPGNGACATSGGVCTLRAAIQEANALSGSDEITVPAGTYTLSIGNNPGEEDEQSSARGDLDITSAVTINGAGADSTTVNGGDLDRIFDAVDFTGAAATISGLTITNGNVQTSTDGGGIYVGLGTTLDLEDSTVSENTVFFRGGGLKNLGTLTLTNSAVIDNTAENGSGGGIENVGILTLTDSTVNDNDAPLYGVGGGISNTNALTGITATVTMTNSTVSGNSALNSTGGAGRSGGIDNNGGNLTITDSTVSNNTATYIAGGIYNWGGNLTMTGSTVSGNTTQREGGGVLSEPGTTHLTTISNSTISGNRVTGTGENTFGGGISSRSGRTVVENTTITNNTAPANQGSGVASVASSSVSTEVGSTIIAGNTNTDVDIVSSSTNSFDSNGYNLIGDGNATAAFNQPGDRTGIADPKLGPLADNGGPTSTHALLAGSLAIDAANPVCPPPATDQRGVERVQDGDGNGTPRCDIGSFERGPFLSVSDVVVREGNSGTTDATFTVTLSPPSGQTVTVDYGTANGKAKAPGDYEARSGTLVFEPGRTTKTVVVPVKGDKKYERTEHFFLNLSGATNASIADGQGKSTIRNDDKKRRR
jgi:CSLREA domain-containing protein